MSKPYDVQFPSPQEGDPIGWQDRDGVVHVERLKRFTSNGVELETGPDPVQRAHDALSTALDEVLDVEAGVAGDHRRRRGTGMTGSMDFYIGDRFNVLKAAGIELPPPPPGLREAWSDGPAPQWDITVGDEGEKA